MAFVFASLKAMFFSIDSIAVEFSILDASFRYKSSWSRGLMIFLREVLETWV